MIDLALLAPVPLVHLEDGVEVCKREGKVAFASRAFKLFRRLDEMRAGQPVDVYIYASHADGPPELDVTWKGRYVNSVELQGVARPNDRKYRPPSTEVEDKTVHWAVFWEVEGLRPLTEQEVLAVSTFSSYEKNRGYRTTFVPEGPVIVRVPLTGGQPSGRV